MGKKVKEAAGVFRIPPKMVQNDQGEIVEVILSYADYKTFLRFLADYVDWELLPQYLQDAVDHLLAEEARAEQGDEVPTPLSEVLAELGIELEEDVTPK
jgi:hypothetical protein